MYRVCVWSSAGSAAWQLSLCCLSGTAGTGSRWDFLINCHFCLRGYSTHAYKIVIKATDNSTSVTARSKFLISIPLQPLLPCCPLEYFSQHWLVHCHLKCNVPEAVAARSLPCFSGYHFFLWFIFKRFFFFFFLICIRIRSCANFSGDQFARLFSRKTYSLVCILVWYGNP